MRALLFHLPLVGRSKIRGTRWRKRESLLLAGVLVTSTPDFAQTVAGDTFSDVKDGAKKDIASGFVCPAKIGSFERDAVGESDPATGEDFCAYAALDGVYGTIRLTPLRGATYDPRQAFAADFSEQEGTGGRQVAETTLPASGQLPAIYTRSYGTAQLEDLHYRVLFAGAAVKAWAVEAVIEYAEPRDTADEQDFLHAVYAAAQSEVATPADTSPK